MPRDEIALTELRGEWREQHRLDMWIRSLAVIFVLLLASFSGYYGYTKYVQNEQTPEQKAIAQAIKAIRANPRSAAARVRLGVLYTQAGLTDTAIEQFDEALKIARDDQEALLYAGIAYLNKGDYDQAIKYFDKEIKYYKNTALAGTNISLEQAYYYSAVIHWREKDYDLVIDNAAKALKIKASSADTHLLLGRAYYEKKSYDEAIASFDQALRFDPTYPDALYGAGLAYEGKGDKEKALEQYRKALKAKPDFKQAADAVKRLESAA